MREMQSVIFLPMKHNFAYPLKNSRFCFSRELKPTLKARAADAVCIRCNLSRALFQAGLAKLSLRFKKLTGDQKSPVKFLSSCRFFMTTILFYLNLSSGFSYSLRRAL